MGEEILASASYRYLGPLMAQDIKILNGNGANMPLVLNIEFPGVNCTINTFLEVLDFRPHLSIAIMRD